MADTRTRIGEKYSNLLTFDEFKDGIYWRDHIAEFPGRFHEVEDPEDRSIVAHEPAEGKILQQGTPVNAANLNFRDHAIWSLYQMVEPLITKIQNLQAQMDTMTGAQSANTFVIRPSEFMILDGYLDPVTGNISM